MTAGYSGTPLPRKLGIKPGHRVALLGAPPEFERETLGELPEDVSVRRRAGGKADVIVTFHTSRAELERRLPALRAMMEPAAGLWIAWPKRASKVETDITEDVLREIALPTGPGRQQGLRGRRDLERAAARHPARAPLASGAP